MARPHLDPNAPRRRLRPPSNRLPSAYLLWRGRRLLRRHLDHRLRLHMLLAPRRLHRSTARPAPPPCRRFHPPRFLRPAEHFGRPRGREPSRVAARLHSARMGGIWRLLWRADRAALHKSRAARRGADGAFGFGGRGGGRRALTTRHSEPTAGLAGQADRGSAAHERSGVRRRVSVLLCQICGFSLMMVFSLEKTSQALSLTLTYILHCLTAP